MASSLPVATEAATEKKASISFTYWPPVGRTLSMVCMLEDAGVAYNRVDFNGGPMPDPSIVAVPFVEIDGNYVSQTLAIMEYLGDELGYLPPSKAQNKAQQCMFNIYDIIEQALAKRKEEIKTKSDAAKFVEARVAQFFVAIEAGYKEYPGSMFYGENPCVVDFLALHAVLILKFMFGDEIVTSVLAKAAPTVAAAANAVAARPKVKAVIDSKFGGRPMLPPSMKVDATFLTE
jgi:glutathione S-transferase